MPFLEFFDTGLSPFQAMVRYGGIWRLALPAFLSLPVFAAYLIWSVRGRFSRASTAILYALCTATACLIIWNVVTAIEESGRRASFAVLGAMACLGAGAVLLSKSLRSGDAHPLHPAIALQVCYASNVVFCIMLFVYPGTFGGPHLNFTGWGLGGYPALATIVLYPGQIWTAMQSS